MLGFMFVVHQSLYCHVSMEYSGLNIWIQCLESLVYQSLECHVCVKCTEFNIWIQCLGLSSVQFIHIVNLSSFDIYIYIYLFIYYNIYTFSIDGIVVLL